MFDEDVAPFQRVYKPKTIKCQDDFDNEHGFNGAEEDVGEKSDEYGFDEYQANENANFFIPKT